MQVPEDSGDDRPVRRRRNSEALVGELLQTLHRGIEPGSEFDGYDPLAAASTTSLDVDLRKVRATPLLHPPRHRHSFTRACRVWVT